MTEERLADRPPQLPCPTIYSNLYLLLQGLPEFPGGNKPSLMTLVTCLMINSLLVFFPSLANLSTFLLLFPEMTLNKPLALESLSHSMLQRDTKQRQYLFMLWPGLAIFVCLGEISESWRPKSHRNSSLNYFHFSLLILQLKSKLQIFC